MREGFLGGSDKLGPALLQPSLVFILLVEPLVMAELLLADSVYWRTDSGWGLPKQIINNGLHSVV